ncbi:hypothetical protein, partial [Pseudomonas sp. FEN]
CLSVCSWAPITWPSWTRRPAPSPLPVARRSLSCSIYRKRSRPLLH